jgi:hydrogenase maturation protease
MLTIIGCGNSNRSDDGVGVVAAQKLQAYLRDNPHSRVRVFDAGTAGMDVMFQARGSRALIIIDANRSGSKPGTIFTVPGHALENLPQPSYNLHDFRWDHALFAGGRIFKEAFPTDITVYLIEAGDLSFGLELSSDVKIAANVVCEAIKKRIGQYNG